MPWKETCPVVERALFVQEYLRGELTMSELCRQHGISRKTGYKFLGRFEAEGKGGLVDRSHAPHACPHGLSGKTIERLIEVRRTHMTWGPRKVRAYLMDRYPRANWPAASTIGDLYAREGLTVPRRKRRKSPASAPFATALEPNDIWTVDFKGWFRTGDGERCNPLTMQDAQSRFLLRCQALEKMDVDAVWPIFDAAFREFGLPQFLRSDNGSPFASVGIGGLSPLSIRVIKAGVTPERIEPGKPQQNGRLERFHLTLARETASPPAADRTAQQRVFNRFRRSYNEERPHEALGQIPPTRIYRPSPRRYSGRLREPEYGGDVEVRRVRSRGEIKWRGNSIYVGEALAGEPVALEEIDDAYWRLRYGPIELGTIDRMGELERPARKRRGRNEGRGAALRNGSAPRPSHPTSAIVRRRPECYPSSRSKV